MSKRSAGLTLHQEERRFLDDRKIETLLTHISHYEYDLQRSRTFRHGARDGKVRQGVSSNRGTLGGSGEQANSATG